MMVGVLYSIATSGPADILLIDEWITGYNRDSTYRASKRLHGYIDEVQFLVRASRNPELLRVTCNRALLLKPDYIIRVGFVDEIPVTYAHSNAA